MGTGCRIRPKLDASSVVSSVPSFPWLSPCSLDFSMPYYEHQHSDEVLADGTQISARNLLAFAGPTIDVVFELPEALARPIRHKGGIPPTPVRGRAVIDTGKLESIVDETVCLGLGAVETGTAVVENNGAFVQATCYAIKMSFVDDWSQPIYYPKMATADLGFSPPDNPILCILGRDFLADKMMIYNGRRGRFELHK